MPPVRFVPGDPRCTKCGRRFANKNQTHFCSDVGLESHFEQCRPRVPLHFGSGTAHRKRWTGQRRGSGYLPE